MHVSIEFHDWIRNINKHAYMHMLYSPSKKHTNSGFTFAWDSPTQFQFMYQYTIHEHVKNWAQRYLCKCQFWEQLFWSAPRSQYLSSVVRTNIFCLNRVLILFFLHLFCFSLFMERNFFLFFFLKDQLLTGQCHYQQYWTKQLLLSNIAGSDI